MKYCVLGAGLMGKAIAFDLLRQSDTTSVLIVDKDEKQLIEALRATSLQGNKRLSTRVINANNLEQVESIFQGIDSAIAAMHYSLNENFTKVAIKSKVNLCDLGGNSAVVDEQLKMNTEAQKAVVSIIPDCGLAPGLVSVLVKWGVKKFPWVDTVKIRVGGLPQNPKGILKYERLFSVEGLINEYIEPVRVLRDGEIKMIEPLAEIEEISFTGATGQLPLLEAFTTSGGVSTLVETYKERLKNLDYKTIRYKGHCNVIRTMYELGFFHGENRRYTKELFEKNIPICKEDVTLVKIIFEGKSKKHELEIIDNGMKDPPLTSMMRTTAFPASIISQMQARKQIKKLGVQTQENCVSPDLFISELTKRGIVVKGIS